MKDRIIIFIFLIFIFLLTFLPERADALRCGSDLVLKGYRKMEVLKKCGEPEFKEEWVEEIVTHITDEKNRMSRDLMIGTESQIGKSNITHLEEWVYNFGPRSFMQYLTFVNGRLRNIEDGPRGFKGNMLAGSSKSRCGHLVERGDRKIEVIINCGDPYSIEYLWEERFSDVLNSVRVRKIPGYYRDGDEFKIDYKIVRERMYEQKRIFINIEEWTYNYGPGQFLYFITLENGRVVKIEEGGYGFED